MIRLFALLLALSAMVALDCEPVFAQSNNNEYTPLNSRIRRARPLPTEPRSIWQPRQLSDAQRARSRTMVDQMARCIWGRSNEKGLDLLERTDFGFTTFQQIGIASSEITERYPVETCLSRVALNANSSIMLRFDAPSMRSWYLQAAYFDRYRDGPEWLQPGLAVDERTYPLSGDRPEVQAVMNFADCLVAQDPYGADYFYRTAAGTDAEVEAIRSLVPAMSPCLPEGQELEINPSALRQWVGEGLWHASSHLVPANENSAEGSQ